MTTPSVIFNAATRKAGHVSAADNEYLKVLYDEHVHLRAAGKVIFFIPRNIGVQMGHAELEGLANGLCLLTGAEIFVHYIVERFAFRVGQVADKSDYDCVASNVFIYKSLPHSGSLVVSMLGNATQQNGLGISLPGSPTGSATDDGAVPMQVKIPKPRNQWIIFRAMHHKSVLAKYPNMHTSKISTIIADLWRRASPEVKAQFQRLAAEEKAKHQALYPNFRCSPRKSSSIKRRQPSRCPTQLPIPSPAAGLQTPGFALGSNLAQLSTIQGLSTLHHDPNMITYYN